MPAESVVALPRLIFLTGYMGVGKSTIGRAFAKVLGYTFDDTDQMLCEQFGQPISAIFETHGEPAFREAERALIEALTTPADAAANSGDRGAGGRVISVGGGTLARQDTLSVALSGGFVVYLELPIEVLYERVIFSPKERPMVNVPDAEARFYERFEAREPFYRQAHMTFNTEGLKVPAVVERLLSRLNEDPCHAS